MPRAALLLAAGVACLSAVLVPAAPPKPAPAKPVPVSSVVAPAAVGVMPWTGLAPARIVPDLCKYQYRVSTPSEMCQKHVDQALGYFYSYVWMEAARSFETALRHDPSCAFAWWGLSKSLERWGKSNHMQALQQAQALLPKASHREQLLITARLQEKGVAPGVGPDQRTKKAAATLDDLLTVYDDDEEGWFARAQIAGGTAGIPYYKALLRLNPLHPGANHELVHFYENYKRPALGWPYAQGYMDSSPGLPHAFHMQAHLAMRIGKWAKTSDWSARAIDLERAYHKELNVRPNEDHQFSHHLETLTRSLVHDGRFAEARAIRQEALGYGYKYPMFWFRMFLAEHDWNEALKIVADYRRTDKPTAAYLAALVYLEQGDVARARPEVDVLRQASQQRKNDRRLELKLWEVQGRLLCQTGSGEAGLKLLKRAVDRTKDDYGHHAWGEGASNMEAWGVGALEAGDAAAAEEAFLEALAHDAGSVRAALGLQAMCERLGRTDEAQRYAAVAKRCWAKADSRHFEALRNDMVKRAAKVGRATAASAGEEDE